MSLSKPHRGTRCIVSTLSGNHNVSLNLFPSHPCAVHSAIRLRDAGIITIQQHDMDLAVGKWHAILTHPGTEIARAQQSIPYRKRVESNSVSQSVTLPCTLQRSLATSPAVDKWSPDIIAYVSSVMRYDLLYVVRNHVILYNIKRYLNSYEYLDLLIATYNPLQEAWVFCERTRIFTCLRPPSPCCRSRRRSRSPASSGPSSRSRPACPDHSADANCPLIGTL